MAKKLVSLKVLSAHATKRNNEVQILAELDRRVKKDPRRDSIQKFSDDFLVDGPNGTHRCLVYEPGGPDLAGLFDFRENQYYLLRPAMTRKIARQLVDAVACLHSADIVHGDIGPRNVLLRLKDIETWKPKDVIEQFENLIQEKPLLVDGGKPDQSAPEYLIQASEMAKLDYAHLSDRIQLIDFGEAFDLRNPP